MKALGQILKYALAALIAASAPVFAAEELVGVQCSKPQNLSLEPHDTARLAGLIASRTRGMAEAMISENGMDRALLSALYANGLYQPDPVELGPYQCRTLKLGGLGALTVYGWFSCEINAEDAAIVLHKTTGSQQLFGLLTEAKNGLIYRGALIYGYEDELVFYGDHAERNQVGCFSQIGTAPGHYLLELPSPTYESVHDLLELKRLN